VAAPLDDQRLAREYVVNKSIRLWVHADGIVAFDFSRWGPGKRIVDRDKDERELEDVFLRRCRLMNAFSFALGLSLDAQGWSPRYLAPADHLHFIDPADRPLGTWPSWLTDRSLKLEKDQIDAAVDLFSRFVRHQLVDQFDLMSQAWAHQQAHAYEAALTAAWPVVEHLLRRTWDRYLDANRRRPHPAGVVVDGGWAGATEAQLEEMRTSYQFIDEKRWQLLHSEAFGAAVIIDVLSLLDELPMEAYRTLTRARGARNRWLHRLHPVNNLDSEAAFDAVSALTMKLYGIEFELRTGGSLSGFTLDGAEERVHRSIPELRPWASRSADDT